MESRITNNKAESPEKNQGFRLCFTFVILSDITFLSKTANVSTHCLWQPDYEQIYIKRKRAHDMCALFVGVPEGIRTPDLLLRRQSLYPAELRKHLCIQFYCVVFLCIEKLSNTQSEFSRPAYYSYNEF